MKNKVLTLMMFIISGLFIHAQENPFDKPFYYYKEDKFYLEVDYSRITVISKYKFDAKIESKIPFSIKNEWKSYTKHIIVLLNENDKTIQDKEIFITEIEFSEVLKQSDYRDVILLFSQADNVIKTMPAYTISGQKLSISNNFCVKLFKESDKDKLFELAKKHSIQVLGYNEFMPLWITLSCDKESFLNAMEAANLFYETGLFESAEPELLYHNLLASNDQYFSEQWGLKNTGQYGGVGVDINVSQAWNITTGSPNIRVAIFDQGVQMNHPDLINNIYGTGYDAETNRTPSVLRGIHGVPCSGIIAAQQNNTAGISGVAPNSKLISISLNFTWSNTPQQLANGFNWAWQNGADVISNSWGGYPSSTILDDAIINAQTKGRNGFGCIVIFASGNENDTNIRYPGNNNPNILVVGAISPCGERKSPASCDGEDWGSCYGNRLDVVAPGVLIPTTDRIGIAGYNPDKPELQSHPEVGGNKITSDYTDLSYTVWFQGTSAAAPHVSGIAALVLSVNPDLTQKQVADVIESTAQKVGGYNYTGSTAHPNGTWNNEMGHGLVDAYEAVKKAKDMYCPTTTLAGTQPPPHSTSKRVVCKEIKLQNVTVPSGTSLKLKATGGAITIDANTRFRVEAGARFTVE